MCVRVCVFRFLLLAIELRVHVAQAVANHLANCWWYSLVAFARVENATSNRKRERERARDTHTRGIVVLATFDICVFNSINNKLTLHI